MSPPQRASVIGRSIALIALLVTPCAVGAQSYQKILPSDYPPGPYTQYGWSLALDDDTLTVGDPAALFEGRPTGAVYVFELRRGTWVESAKLGPPNVEHPIDFGQRVALQHDRLVVAAPGAGTGVPGAGAVYVFERSAGRWGPPAVLAAKTPAAGESLGVSVALSGDVVAASTLPQIIPVARDSRVYVFERDPRKNRWYPREVMLDPGGGNPFEAPASFGLGLTFAGPELAIPASLGSGEPYVVYLRRRAETGSWRAAGKVFTGDPGEPGAYPESARAVATPSRLVVGSTADAGGQGALYVYDRGPNGFTLDATLVAARDPRPGQHRRFGDAIAVAGDRIAAGASDDDQGRGSLILFERGGARWKERLRLSPLDETLPHGSFGVAVAMDDRTLAVSSSGYFPWEPPSFGGAVYVYRLDDLRR